MCIGIQSHIQTGDLPLLCTRKGIAEIESRAVGRYDRRGPTMAVIEPFVAVCTVTL